MWKMCVCFKCYCKLHLDYNSNWSTPGKSFITVPWFHVGFVSPRNEAEVWCGRGPTGCRESAGWQQPLPQELEHMARIQPLWFWRRTIYIQISLQLEPRLFLVAAAFFLLKSLKNKKSLNSRPKILIFIMLSLTQSLTALEESSFFLSLGLVCDEFDKLTPMGVVLPIYLLWICRTCLFLRMEKTVRLLLRTTLKFRTQVYA